MAKRKHSAKSAKADPAGVPEPPPDEQVFAYGNLSLHDLFQQQAMAMLDRADVSEEAKQEILVAMACPCCGAGAMSYTVKLKR
ncbi:MAG: hypothetical protein GEU91_03575 [Rhizobiales bacterium]|nr:hypothetical protein [Hyphomicrobiales bacterium]